MKIMSSSIKAGSTVSSKVRRAYDALDDLMYYLESDPKNAESVDINQQDLDLLNEASLILMESVKFAGV